MIHPVKNLARAMSVRFTRIAPIIALSAYNLVYAAIVPSETIDMRSTQQSQYPQEIQQNQTPQNPSQIPQNPSQQSIALPLPFNALS